MNDDPHQNLHPINDETNSQAPLASKPRFSLMKWFKTNQNNVNTGLGLMAIILAIVPYVLPKASEQIVGTGLNPIVFDKAVIAYQGHKDF